MTMGLPMRSVIAVMIFSGVCINYMMRVNLSVNLVAMVPVGNATVNQDSLQWSVYERAQILGGYQWGYLASTFFGGSVAEIWGPRIVIFVTTLFAVVLTGVSPLAAKHSFELMLVVRILLGFFGGFMIPALHALIGKWAVPNEKGVFIGSLVFGTIGTVIAWSLCGVLIQNFGWEWGFYAFSILGTVYTIIWWFFVYDTPDKHPYLTLKEKQFLDNGISSSTIVKKVPPYKHIITSLPVWSLIIQTFGTGWGIYFVITAAPNYIANVLGYKITSTGFLSASLYLSRSICAFVIGSLSDILLKKNIVTVALMRKFGCILSYIVPACMLLGVTHPDITPSISIVLLILAMGFNGAVTISSIANGHDLTRNYVGTIIGIANTFATLAGVIIPFVTAYFTQHDETSADAWRAVFYVGAAVYIGAGLQFFVIGSTKTQHWNAIGISQEK